MKKKKTFWFFLYLFGDCYLFYYFYYYSQDDFLQYGHNSPSSKYINSIYSPFPDVFITVHVIGVIIIFQYYQYFPISSFFCVLILVLLLPSHSTLFIISRQFKQFTRMYKLLKYLQISCKFDLY